MMRIIKFGGIVNMGKKLAIKGHSTCGKEIIEILEMLGGRNSHERTGNNDETIYYIDDRNNINCDWTLWNNNRYTILTLEEFLEKYPFKVGDKVIDDSGESGIIIEMKWDEEIIYKVDFGKECYYFTSDFLRPYKETNMNENKFGTTKESLELKSNAMKLVDDRCERTHEDVIFDSIIWHLRNSVNNGKQNLSGGECEEYFREVVKKNNENKMKNVLAELLEHIKTTPKEELEREFEEIKEWSDVGPTVEEFRTFCECVNKKPVYPKTYEECCEVLDYCGDYFLTTYDNNGNPSIISNILNSINILTKLLICRDAYWKIAGEKMGLNEPWEPDWDNGLQKKYAIYPNLTDYVLGSKNKIYVGNTRILVFPTEEMRDVFYENFKDLIESCKELL